MRESIRQRLWKYKQYSEAYEEKMLELQKRAAKIFMLLFTVYIGMAHISRGVAKEEAIGSVVVIAVSLLHYMIFNRYAVKHRKSIRPLACIYCIVILKILISVSAFYGGGLSFIAIDVAMILMALTIVVPMHYWLILAVTMVWSVVDHVLWIRGGEPLTSYEIEAWYVYIMEYIFLCLFALVINISFSNMKQKEIETEQRLLWKNNTDALTGLYNRPYIEDCVNRAQTGIMICIDLDNFKKVNDCFGHKQGDEILINVSHIFRKHFRKTDCIARVGGDEFLIFLEDMTERERILDRIRSLLSEFPIVLKKDEEEVAVTLSVGVVFGEGSDMTYRALYEKSDEMMYKAKNSGKGKAVIQATAHMPETVITGGRER